MPFFSGFDSSSYPGDSQLDWLKQIGGMDWCGYYLAPAPSHGDPSWTGHRAALVEKGWGLAPLYVGEQVIPPGSQHPSAAKGGTDGEDAARLMVREGFQARSVVFLDLEDGSLKTESRQPGQWKTFFSGLLK